MHMHAIYAWGIARMGKAGTDSTSCQPASEQHDRAAEASGIDMDQTSTNAIPAAVRPPAALLALESTSSATGGDGDTGNYRVSYHYLQSSVLNVADCLLGSWAHASRQKTDDVLA